jgi:MFS family permease
LPGGALSAKEEAMVLTSLLMADVGVSPNINNLPGGPVVQSLTDGLAGWALIAAVLGMVIGAVAWAFGQHSQNYQQAYTGRKGVIISGAAALLIGAAPHVVNFFSNLGNTVH